MKKFLINTTAFISILLILFLIGVFLPATPRASKSLLHAKIQKDELLKNTQTPRIILIGGSNLSFGINSHIIKDSLHLNPINTGVHANIGLIYMMNQVLPYIKKDDILIVIPEYSHYYDDFAYGGQELLRTVFDVSPADLATLSLKQWLNIYKLIPKYAFTKFKISEYIGYSQSKIYSVSSFNKFGDVYTHWDMKQEKFESNAPIGEKFNYDVIDELKKYETEITNKGAKLYISYPGFQESEFYKNRKIIQEVEKSLKNANLSIIGDPENYRIPDSMMFNSRYHLLKTGVDYRTNMLISDYKKEVKRP